MTVGTVECPKEDCNGVLTEDTPDADVRCTTCGSLFRITLEKIGVIEKA